MKKQKFDKLELKYNARNRYHSKFKCYSSLLAAAAAIILHNSHRARSIGHHKVAYTSQ